MNFGVVLELPIAVILIRDAILMQKQRQFVVAIRCRVSPAIVAEEHRPDVNPAARLIALGTIILAATGEPLIKNTVKAAIIPPVAGIRFPTSQWEGATVSFALPGEVVQAWVMATAITPVARGSTPPKFVPELVLTLWVMVLAANQAALIPVDPL